MNYHCQFDYTLKLMNVYFPNQRYLNFYWLINYNSLAKNLQSFSKFLCSRCRTFYRTLILKSNSMCVSHCHKGPRLIKVLKINTLSLIMKAYALNCICVCSCYLLTCPVYAYAQINQYMHVDGFPDKGLCVRDVYTHCTPYEDCIKGKILIIF